MRAPHELEFVADAHGQRHREMERTAGIKPASERWRRPALSLSYVRMVGSGRNRTSCPAGTAFTAQRPHQHVLIGTSRNCSRSFEMAESRGLDPHTLRCLPASNGCRTPVRLTFRNPRSRAAACNSSRRHGNCGRCDWRKIECTILTRASVPNAFQASPAPRPVNLPEN